jgi:hypothetical protein
MTQLTHEQRLREDWYKCWKGGEMPEIMEKSADWWLAKHRKFVEQVREQIEKCPTFANATSLVSSYELIA